jgi:hypothetical protein
MLSFPRFLLFLCIFYLFPPREIRAQELWKPGIHAVPEIPDCKIFDIAISQFSPKKEIRYCLTRFESLNFRFPGAGHFYFVHEYGHIILQEKDEELVDKWVCDELTAMDKGYMYINAFLRHLLKRCMDGEGSIPGYGTPCERMDRIIDFTQKANPYLCFDPILLQFDE